MRIRKKTPKPSKSELERLRQALNRAAQSKNKTLEQLNERRAELPHDFTCAAAPASRPLIY